MGKFSFSYVDQPSIPSALICLICKLPFEQPVEHINCGNEFCEACALTQAKCVSCNDDIDNNSIRPANRKLFTQVCTELMIKEKNDF